ncbi:12532_t:CDS:1 [Acaulospora morrowiae]|uniref:12532_t:CDS:1 n=1 Tax=Acaulospora morrowiae TaxID=94023 RepID=A0A9N9BDT2_9GLOM|nr:12532_t:CDS:1 [Acaulospora morrowiae]
MGQLSLRKKVILPVYRPTDHTPSVYKDPFSERIIPVGYFLNNLDEIGPLHYENGQTADYLLNIVRCDEINLWCEYFDQYFHQSFNRNLTVLQGIAQQQQQLIPSKSLTPIHTKCHKDANALDAAVLTNCVNYMVCGYNQLLLNYHQYFGDRSIGQTSLLPSPPGSPTSPSYDHFTFTNAPNNKPTVMDFSRPTSHNFYAHTLVLASQSGFFNQLFGPINNPTSSLCNLHRQQSPPSSPTSPTSPHFCSHPQFPIQLTVPIPHPECFGIILHWLYHHDDDAWLDEITPENFIHFYENIKFLKLGKEAFDVLDAYIAEAEEDGLEITGEGVVEIY